MITFRNDSFEELCQWEEENKQVYKKICRLISEIQRDPFHGTGKPEPLKWDWAGHWSRRITDEHRLVYKVLNDQIIIVSCKHHY